MARRIASATRMKSIPCWTAGWGAIWRRASRERRTARTQSTVSGTENSWRDTYPPAGCVRNRTRWPHKAAASAANPPCNHGQALFPGRSTKRITRPRARPPAPMRLSARSEESGWEGRAGEETEPARPQEEGDSPGPQGTKRRPHGPSIVAGLSAGEKPPVSRGSPPSPRAGRQRSRPRARGQDRPGRLVTRADPASPKTGQQGSAIPREWVSSHTTACPIPCTLLGRVRRADRAGGGSLCDVTPRRARSPPAAPRRPRCCTS